jgi:hypothetical protein
MAEKVSTRTTEADNAGYEKRDVSAVKLIVFGGLSLIIVVVILVFLYEYFTVASGRMVEEMVLKPQSAALRELRARETEELNNYKLLDAERGIYRIPISRAIELIADEAYRQRRQASIGD